MTLHIKEELRTESASSAAGQKFHITPDQLTTI